MARDDSPVGGVGLPPAADLMAVLDGLPVMMTATEGPELRLVAMSAPVQELSRRPDWLGQPLAEVYPELVGQGMVAVLEDVFRTGQPYTNPEWRVELYDAVGGGISESYVHWTGVPWTHPDGSVRGVINLAQDVTAQVLARHAAEQAAENAGQRYQQAVDVVGELQQALLPSSLPVLPGLDIAARYLVAGAEQSAGGDWFDARPLPDGRVALVIGDVVGHGVAAAVVMGQLRAVLADALDTSSDPVAAVTRLERFAGSVPGARSATLVVAVVDADGGAVEYLTRGHPAPLLVDAAGQVRQLLGSGGGPLGSSAGGPALRTTLGQGDVLVLFSDGLVERPDRSYTAGLDELARLAQAATAGQVWPAGTSVHAVDRICTDAVGLLTRRGFDDDVTVLAAQVTPVVAPLRVRITATAEELPRARQAVRDWLTAVQAAPDDQLALELSIGEAVDNAVEHGFEYLSGVVLISLDLLPDGHVHVHVIDDGMWKDRSVVGSGRGTGLRLMDSLGRDLTVDGHPSGTTVTFTRRLARPVATTPTGPARPASLPPAGGQYASRARSRPPTLWLSGPLDALSARRLRADLAEHSHGGTVPLTVDLTDVSHLTSVGVAALADLLHVPARADHTPELVAPTGSPAAYVLDLVGLPRRPAPAISTDAPI